MLVDESENTLSYSWYANILEYLLDISITSL